MLRVVQNSIKPESYSSKICCFFPQLNKGHCLGHAHMGTQALLASDLDSFVQRLEFIYYGVPRQNNSNERITLGDLEKLYIEFSTNEESKLNDTSNVLSTKSEARTETEIEKKTETENDENTKKTKEMIAALQTLIDEHLPKFAIPSDYKNFISNDTNINLGNLFPEIPLLAPDELKKQIELANKIRSNFIKKAHTELMKNRNSQLTNKQISQLLFASLAEFDKNHPYLWQLIEIEIFFSNVAMYHAGHQLSILSRKGHLSQCQTARLFSSLLTPTILDEKNHGSKSPIINKVNSFTHQYSMMELQAALKSLEDIIQEKIKKNKFGFSLQLNAQKHICTLGYNVKYKRWILIDSEKPYPYEVESNNIAHEIFEIFFSHNMITLNSENFVTTLFFNFLNKEFTHIKTSQKTTKINSEIDFIPLLLATTSHIRKIEDAVLNLSITIYANNINFSAIQEITSTWINTPEFKKAHQITSAHSHSLDSIYNKPLLQLACGNDDRETVKKLIEVKATIDATGNLYRSTPLLAAIDEGNTEIVNLLLDAKADPNIVSMDEGFPLRLAAQRGSTETIRSLIKASANIDQRSGSLEQNALITAVACGQAEATQILLQNGAKSRVGEAVQLGEVFGSAKAPNLCKNDPALIDKGLDNYAILLLLAFKNNYTDVINVLINHGACLDTALLIVERSVDNVMVKALVSNLAFFTKQPVTTLTQPSENRLKLAKGLPALIP